MAFVSPMIAYLLRWYVSHLSAAIAVCRSIADCYRRDFDFPPLVVLNVPESETIPPHDVDPEHIQLMHHGGAQRNRRQETMIEAPALMDSCIDLRLILIATKPRYMDDLGRLAEHLTPGK